MHLSAAASILGVIYSLMSALDHAGLGGIWLRCDWFSSEHEKLKFSLVFMYKLLHTEKDVGVKHDLTFFAVNVSVG